MKRAAILVSALAVVLYTVAVGAQAKPSFAGKWTMDMPAGGAMPGGGGAPGGGAPGGGGGGRGGGRGGGGPVSGMEVTITQDANTLTINKTQGQNPVTLKYTLDGKDSKNTVQGRGGAVEQTSQATWDGSKLVITTSADMGRGPMTTKQALSIEGGNLVVENIGADGTAMGKLTYKKGM